jgi:D-glutamate cyclase
MPKILGEYIDRLCTVEMRRQGTAPRGYVRTLYEAALQEGGGDPLSHRAASLLLERCTAGKPIFIFCSAGVPPYLPYGETDGPLGGAAIARAINVATGALPVFVSTDAHGGPVIAAAKAIGLNILPAAVARQRPAWAAVHEVYNPTEVEEVEARVLLDRYEPTALVSVECLGPNRNGVTVSALGYPVANNPAYHNFFRIAGERRIATLGVGDGGNEIGCGRIQSAVRARFPNPPGGVDLATTISTDVLFFATVSNWGGYGIAAMLAFLSKKPAALHTAELDRRMLEAVCMAGASEAAQTSLEPAVDGIEGRVHADLVNTLRVMVHNASTPIYRPF